MANKDPSKVNRFSMENQPIGRGRPSGASLKAQVQTLFIEMMAEETKYNGKKLPFLTAWKSEFVKSALEGGWAAKILTDRLFSENILESIDRSLNKSLREDEDFQQFRILKQGHNVQQRIILDSCRRILCMAGRRAGKTEGNILKITSVAIQDNKNALIVCLTHENAINMYWKGLLESFEGLGYSIEKQDRTEGLIQLSNGSMVSLKGNNTITDREKFRGFAWDIVVIDEVQSQHSLPYLINDILEPTLIDRDGTLMLTGTGPRVRGTYWEVLWNDEKKQASKYNWNLSVNPFIKNHAKILDQIKEEKGLTDSSPLFQREYLGMCVYDDDAQVYRLTDANYFDDNQLTQWIASQPRGDLMFSAGLDYGYEDSDAFVIVLFSKVTQEKFVIFEHKGNRTGVTELADKMKEGIAYVNMNPIFASIPEKHFYIYADTGGAGKKISYELQTQFALPTLDAYKANKDFAVEILQEEVRTGLFKVRPTANFADEALKTVWKRNEKDELTRIIDDDTYHPDTTDAVLYSCRNIWINYRKSN